MLGPKDKLIEEAPPALRRKKRRAKPLEPMAKLKIAYEVLVLHQKMAEVAAEFDTSVRVVSGLTKKAKNKLSEITDAIEADHQRWAKEQEIKRIIESIRSSGLTINKAE